MKTKIVYDRHDFTVTPTFFGYIRVGSTQGVKNWQTALLFNSQREDVQNEFNAAVERIAVAGNDVVANTAYTAHFEAASREFTIIYGVVANRLTRDGKTAGEYRFVCCFADEVEAVKETAFGDKAIKGLRV